LDNESGYDIELQFRTVDVVFVAGAAGAGVDAGKNIIASGIDGIPRRLVQMEEVFCA
tara:strand:- start:553 stop:723 length:171 start_codon:yes stop_codon:yes gene_type:complete